MIHKPVACGLIHYALMAVRCQMFMLLGSQLQITPEVIGAATADDVPQSTVGQLLSIASVLLVATVFVMLLKHIVRQTQLLSR